ncbi:flagellar biosynthesis protein FlhF [uncultured Spongiibacter sp.]|uniref:flagellar biosynthesis protein FlhF n=1 Tax=Spongiibacter marinus TaxID=354246 RepID=UPI002599552F|nr:flagellar biosynthesis protein FlhF [uncultured Spongiibacter sp.]MEE2653845.1 flagellar biosynthesis protein FlhF [Pseudomonadota bacterium]
MNVKKYRAADSEQAMRMIRAAHGPDAVILDCQSVAGGVELVVSWEGEPSLPTATDADKERTALDALRSRREQAESPAPAARQEAVSGASGPQLAWSQNDELHDLKQELAAMKSMLMSQLKDNNWQQLTAKQPAKKSSHQMLSAMDIDPSIAESLQRELPSDESEAVQREMLKMLLVRQLPISEPPRTGAICLLGPQGAGKTTTIAKLAAQHVMQHGRDDIAILTTDSGRVGAQEQLRAYGRILQIPVHSADSPQEAARTFRVLQKKSVVLIDTAGLSFRDHEGLDELEKLLAGLGGAHCYLTLPADVEAYVQSEIIDAYSRFNLAGVVISRIDEAMRLGGLLSNLIQHRLPAVWCTNGPKVPQNLCVADAGKLVNMAMKMAMSFTPPARRQAADSGRAQHIGVQA